MTQPLTKKRLSPASLRGARTPHTVLLQMARDLDRAQRIRQLYDERPDLTWTQIAEGVDVKERSVHTWAKTGAMKNENAVKLAEFFKVDADWLWRGPKVKSPDLMGALHHTANGSIETGEPTQLDRIEAMLVELLRRVGDDGLPVPEGELGRDLSDDDPTDQDPPQTENPEAPGAPPSTGE